MTAMLLRRSAATVRVSRLMLFIALAVQFFTAAPASAQIFNDVPADYWAAPYIEAVAIAGISAGCGGGNYCPSDNVTRAQMAIFLERGMRGGSFNPPPATGNVFVDVRAADFGASFIEQLFRDGITSGCGNGNYCPGDIIKRDQMAVFLLRAKYGSNYLPPAAIGAFDDVDSGYWAAAWIEQLAAEGVTSGCGNANYCPGDPVKRDQMAVFLVRIFDLPLPGDTSGDDPYTGPVAADADTLRFQQELWANIRTTDRCGACHNASVGQVPMFVRNDDVNLAYDEALTVVDTDNPAASRLVEKVGQGHNCWVADPGVCGAIMATWVENWLGTAAGGQQIVLTPPVSIEPGASKKFPSDPTSFQQLIHAPLLEPYCSDCHSSQSQTPYQPYFADPVLATAYAAAKTKINLDTPGNSRFVAKIGPVQFGESHNCWNNDCSAASAVMANAIAAFASGIQPTTVDPNPVYSKALRLTDGTLVSGTKRHEDALIALWEFKTGNGLVAFDSSGTDPAIDLSLAGDVSWSDGWGITIGASQAKGPGKAQGSTTASKKLFDVLEASGEFSIEAWVVPSNVTQESARIVSYSGGQTSRNFTLQQTLYDYDFLLVTSATSLSGDPALSTPDAAEILQARLQHVVATYSPIDGRRIYVDGQLVTAVDPVPGGTFADWQDNFALVLGNEVSGDGVWEGTLRLAAIHRRALTPAQVTQNFDAGIGRKSYLLFDISQRIQAAANSSYILFEVEQYDAYSYLFDNPHFMTLDGSTPSGIAMQGMRVAMNGREELVGQSYANLDVTLDLVGGTQDELGQQLSALGAVLPLEKGPDADEFFLTFDNLNGAIFNRGQDPMLTVTDRIATADERTSDIGVKTFDEIDATYAAITGIDRTGNVSVDATYQEIRDLLPAVDNIEMVSSSHQFALARLAMQYCDAAVSDATIWPGFNFDAAPATAFSVANRESFVEPLIARAVGHSSTSAPISTQPAYSVVYEELASFQAAGNRPDNLIDRLLLGTSDTRAIAKGVCTAVLGSAVTLIQ